MRSLLAPRTQPTSTTTAHAPTVHLRSISAGVQLELAIPPLPPSTRATPGFRATTHQGDRPGQPTAHTMPAPLLLSAAVAASAAVVASGAAAAAAATAGAPVTFRAPAIPLLTTDPFMQTWLRGDTSTSTGVTHWDGQAKTTNAVLRLSGGGGGGNGEAKSFQLLGVCTPTKPAQPGPKTDLGSGHDVSPGSHDISNFEVVDEDDCNRACYGTTDCLVYVLFYHGGGTTCFLKSAAAPVVASIGSKHGFLIDTTKKACAGDVAPATQKAVHIFPTRTVFELEAGSVPVNLTFLSTMFTDDYVRLSRPAYYVDVSIGEAAGDSGADLYVAFSAEHAVNSVSQQVTWSSDAASGGVSVGNAEQKILGSKGDRVNIDWGFLHLLPTGGASAWAGSLNASLSAFLATGALPTAPDTHMPRAAQDDLPGLATAAHVTAGAHHTVVLGYDDVMSVNYFGDEYPGFWTQTYANITAAMQAAASEYDAMRAKSEAHDAALLASVQAAGGDEYAQLCALSYRQTLGATKLVWNTNRSTMWNFLKEISTNGDMQTMDVIYPASPMLLYTNPELLRLLLVPVLAYANNETYVKFGNPYSPHQLGTYPIADSPTAAQEPMPLENSGNMFFMMLGILREQQGDTSWFFPKYWPMLTRWADDLVATSEFPAEQLCTDDFTGKLANNTNLGAKGIVAIEAFAELCRLTGDKSTNCSHYSAVASEYAGVWQQYALQTTPQPHFKMSYNNLPGITDSWSIKYNLLWQKMLALDGPFPWNDVVGKELAYYASKANEFGVPLDPRHTYVKTDWLSWAAAMAGAVASPAAGVSFDDFFHPIFLSVNSTADRNPFTDLYDTKDAHQSMGGFIARPVIGGLFAQALLHKHA